MDESSQFAPAPYDTVSDGPTFYLNTRHPATAGGVVHSMRFCYSLDDSPGVTLYQATVGFFRRNRRRYSLVKSFPVTKNADRGSDEFFCEDMAIPSTEVEQGDLIGVCARNFNSPSQGRINFVVRTNSNRDTLLREATEFRGLFCSSVGDLPLWFPSNVVTSSSRNTLRIYGEIVDSTGTMHHDIVGSLLIGRDWV